MLSIKLICIIAFIIQTKAFLRVSKPILSKIRLCLEDEEWNCGEVRWEMIPITQYTPVGFKETIPKKLDPPQTKYIVTDLTTTPLYKKIKDDQSQLASVSAVAKMSYKELFNIDLFISEFTSNSQTHNLFTPSEMFVLTILSGVAYIYNKTKETEINRIQRLYKFSHRSEYFEKYKEIRRFTMIFFIIITSLFTRNVQIVE